MTAPPRPIRQNDSTRETSVVAAGLASQRRIRSPGDARLARRRWAVSLAKRLLPLVALTLLCSVAFWQELFGGRDRLSYLRGAVEPQSGQMIEAIYHGADARGRPYTMTAATARQVDPERIDLTDPKGDVTMDSGNWLMAQSQKGVYLQHIGSLDLSGDVHLYRDDGTMMTTSAATLDLKASAAAGSAMTHAEGPFGTLDAQGFALTDKGAVIQFTGPGKMVLNAARTGTAPPAETPGAEPAAPAPVHLSPTTAPPNAPPSPSTPAMAARP